LLRERYDAYREEARTRFFDTRFLDFDRQIVLVDVLSALHAGRDAFEDTRHAIADIAASYRYGSNTILSQLAGLASSLLGGAGMVRRIERVAFVATKADHVPASRRDDLVALLRAMADAGGDNAALARHGMSYHAAAAVRATRDDWAMHGTERVGVVVGVPLDANPPVARPFFAGDIPAGLPPERFWTNPYFEAPTFQPPRIDASGLTGIPHIGLDDVLLSVIGDRR
jgi:predicted YcjX-like family ATPase